MIQCRLLKRKEIPDRGGLGALYVLFVFAAVTLELFEDQECLSD